MFSLHMCGFSPGTPVLHTDAEDLNPASERHCCRFSDTPPGANGALLTQGLVCTTDMLTMQDKWLFVSMSFHYSCGATFCLLLILITSVFLMLILRPGFSASLASCGSFACASCCLWGWRKMSKNPQVSW